LDRKQLDSASEWFSNALSGKRDPRWVLLVLHVCMEKSLISEWKKDGTIVFTRRALSEKWRKEAIARAEELYRLAMGGIDKWSGEYT
jgi:hypothetical protein